MTAQLVLDVLRPAKRRGLTGTGVLMHTTEGRQAAVVAYRRLLFMKGFRQARSRLGNGYDKAPAESCLAGRKAEVGAHGIFALVADAGAAVCG